MAFSEPGFRGAGSTVVPRLVSGEPKYRDLVREALSQGGLRVLHAGCGRDKKEITYPYREQCDIVGIDLNAEAGARFHSTFVLGSIEDMSGFFPNDHFDVICCEQVIEHVVKPRAAFLEFARVC